MRQDASAAALALSTLPDLWRRRRTFVSRTRAVRVPAEQQRGKTRYAVATACPRVRAAASGDASPRLFVFGFGYTTLALVRTLKHSGWCVCARAMLIEHSSSDSCSHAGTCLARAVTKRRPSRCAARACTRSRGALTTTCASGARWAAKTRCLRLRADLLPTTPSQCGWPGGAADRHSRRHVRASRRGLQPRPGALAVFSSPARSVRS